MIAIVLAALCAQANQADAVVTVKKKATTWSFALIPEGREKILEDNKEREVDVPVRLFAGWMAVDAKASPPMNVFQQDPVMLWVSFYQPGKRYEGDEADHDLVSTVKPSLAELSEALLLRFFEFDLDFPGGTWDEIGRMLKERVATAYAQQMPELLKPHLPDKIEIDLIAHHELQVRYPAFQAKSITLLQLRTLLLAPLIEVRKELIPRIHRSKSGEVNVTMESEPVLGRWNLSDGHQVTLEDLQVAFFNLAERPGLPRAEDVVALFELAWKARGKPVFARVKYHPETKTIMLQATAEEIGAARRAFASLTGRPLPAEPTINPNPFDGITETLQKIAELIEKQSEGKDK